MPSSRLLCTLLLGSSCFLLRCVCVGCYSLFGHGGNLHISDSAVLGTQRRAQKFPKLPTSPKQRRSHATRTRRTWHKPLGTLAYRSRETGWAALSPPSSFAVLHSNKNTASLFQYRLVVPFIASFMRPSLMTASPSRVVNRPERALI
jgi:hypothetical protein